MISDIPQFVSISILLGMITALLLAWYVLFRGVKNSDMPKEKQTATIFTIGFVLLSWFFVALILGLQGFFEATPGGQFQNMLFTFIPLALGLGLFFYSKTLKQIIDATPMHWLVSIQIYRALGVFFLILYSMQLLPAEFAIPAGIGDILIGITAPLVGYLYFIRKAIAQNLVILWSILGIADLVIAVTLGFLTSPGLLNLLSVEAPNVLVSVYPLVLIPAFGVPLSILLHVFALRKALREKI